MDTNWLGRTVAHLHNLGSKQRRRRLHNARRSRSQLRRSFLAFEMLEDRRLLAASLSINDAMVTEGDAGSVNLDFAVSRGGDDTLSNVTFSFTTSDNSPAPGAATAGVDYTATGGTVTIPSGATSAMISIPVLGDTVIEGDEQLFVGLTGITNVKGPAKTFAAKQDFATGDRPSSVTVGDLNGDGRPDLAVANAHSDNVSVLLNTTAPGATTPSFAAKQDFATGRYPYSVTVGDLNGDGRPDLAVANTHYYDYNVSVLLNTTAPGATTPSFAAKQDFATGYSPQSVTVGDINGDGRPDLAVVNLYSYTVSVLLNTTAPGATTPSFAAKQDFPTGYEPSSVTVGDLNGDGRPDLAVVNADSRNVSVLLNTTAPGATTPSFAAKQDFATGDLPSSVTVGDLNGDGRPDLAVASRYSDNVSVLLNTTAPGATTPSFAAKQDFATGDLPSSVTVGDLNGDGRPDLAVANTFSDNVSVLLNTTAPGATTPSFAAKQDFATGHYPVSVTVGDLNGDGRPDLAVANTFSDNVSVLLNHPAGTTSVNLDVDGNGDSDALTDGFLVLRYLFGFTGTALTDGTLAPNATRTNPADIIAYLQLAADTMLDPDGNGVSDALTDGILNLRYLLGFTGTALTDGALAPDATRTDPAAIIQFLEGYNPDVPPPFNQPDSPVPWPEGGSGPEGWSQPVSADDLLSDGDLVLRGYLEGVEGEPLAADMPSLVSNNHDIGLVAPGFTIEESGGAPSSPASGGDAQRFFARGSKSALTATGSRSALRIPPARGTSDVDQYDDEQQRIDRVLALWPEPEWRPGSGRTSSAIAMRPTKSMPKPTSGSHGAQAAKLRATGADDLPAGQHLGQQFSGKSGQNVASGGEPTQRTTGKTDDSQTVVLSAVGAKKTTAGGRWPREAPAGFEPAVADLQSDALATQPKRRQRLARQ